MDTLELAMKMETDAITFYTRAAGKTSSPAGSKMFLTIAEDERRHLDLVHQLVKGLQMTQADVSPLQRVKTVFENMKNELMTRIAATGDEMEAFKIAMQMEKDGIDLYKKVLAGSSKGRERVLLLRLIEEEEQHYDIFANTYQFLSDTGNWFMWEERGIVEGG